VLVVTILVVIGAAASTHTHYTSLQSGDCFNRISSSSIFRFEVDKVDCAKPHDVEVTGRFEAADAPRYPGVSGFAAEAAARCADLATSYLGQNASVGLRYVWLTPAESSWNRGTRTIVCGLQNADQTRRTGSVAG